MNPGTFFAELKRRNVYKVAVAYAIVGWLLVQVATQVFPFFEIPNWAVRLIVLAIVIGFPIALVIAWAFELTPEGLKRTEDVDVAPQKRRKSHAWIYQARVAYQRAVELDPKFALAWAGLAQAHIWYCNFATEGGQKGFNDHLTAAREAVERALILEPDLPEALSARSLIETNFDYNWKGAAETLRKALALAPQDPALLMQAGNLAAARGEKTQSLEFDRRAVALDPVNALAREYLASALSVTGKQEEARAEYARAIELNPSAPNSHAGAGLTYLLEGKFEEAAVAAQKDAADWARLLIVSCARWSQKRVPESDAALAELIANTSETGAYQIAEVYGYRNDKDHAFEWLERARRQRDAGLPGLRADTLLPNLHDDPRWDAFLRTMGLADDQLKMSASDGKPNA